MVSSQPMNTTFINNSPVISIKNCSFSYGSSLIFKNINLNIFKGETLCILGPNGCGKTTLIDCMLGITRTDQGDIYYGKHNIKGLSSTKIAQIAAYVPQKHARHFAFSVLDVLLMGRAPYTTFYSSPEKSDIVFAGQILDSFGLSHLKHRDYTKLSSGETQLVMIMRALVQDTPIIIMDEPTAHLDFKNELVVLETIVKLVKKRKRTLIMATHFPNHAFYLENKKIAVKVAFINHHKIQMAGSPSKALTKQNLELFYNVKTLITSHNVPDKGSIKQIIPIKTIKTKK